MVGRVLGLAGRRRSEPDRAALILAAADAATFEWDFVRDELTLSSQMAAMTGLPAGVVPARGGKALYDHLHPADIAPLARALAAGLDPRDRRDVQFRLIRPDDGRQLWLAGAVVALRGGRGERLGVLGVVRDISGEKAEADHREAMVSDMDHRVKNAFASVQSLAAQSARRAVSLEAFLETFFGRLEALSSAHTLLTGSRWRGAPLSQIAAAELGGLPEGRANWEGDDIVVGPRATHTLTLALHELSVNAARHGALSTSEGRVDVRWNATPQGGFELIWTETGGPPVSPSTRRGFGSTLLERVTGRELGGSVSLDFRPEGLRAILTGDAGACIATASANGPVPTSTPPGASRGAQGETDIKGLKILIVEDVVLLSLELEAGLTESGAHVVGCAADLDEALAMLALDFDVAVLDANLRGRSVTPMANELAARGIPFIFATGYGEAGAAPAGFSVPVVRKPYNVRQIAAALVAATTREG
jgi:PAS domain S-box-containing protein